MLAVRDTVLYPHVQAPLFVGRERSLRAIDEAMASQRTLLVVAQRVVEEDEVRTDNLYLVGNEAVIVR